MTTLSADLPRRGDFGAGSGLARLGRAEKLSAMLDDPSPQDRLAALMARVAAAQDEAAFSELFAHFAPRLKSYLLRQGADDAAAEELTQEAMLALWRRAGAYDPRIASVSTWLFTIARNKRIDALRRERRPEADPDDLAAVPDPAPAADDALGWRQDAARLRAAMATLPAEQAEMVALAYFQDQTHSAIAAARSLPLGTVKSRLRLAMARLRAALDARVND